MLFNILIILFCFIQKYADLKMELSRTERHILKEMGFICHVEHPHKFISNYLATLGTPPELRQEAWNLANDRYNNSQKLIKSFISMLIFIQLLSS